MSIPISRYPAEDTYEEVVDVAVVLFIVAVVAVEDFELVVATMVVDVLDITEVESVDPTLLLPLVAFDVDDAVTVEGGSIPEATP